LRENLFGSEKANRHEQQLGEDAFIHIKLYPRRACWLMETGTARSGGSWACKCESNVGGIDLGDGAGYPSANLSEY
jgi:hypothetical protein